MVDISAKEITKRVAHAQAKIELPPSVLKLICDKSSDNFVEFHSKKGPVISTAIISGVLAAKNTSNLIPFCHNILIENCKIDIHLQSPIQPSHESGFFIVDCICMTSSKTGIEMEALVGASMAALTVYDMLKAVSHDMVIRDIRLISKKGGKSGNFNTSS